MGFFQTEKPRWDVMRHGRAIVSLAMCGALALTLGACGSGNASSRDDSSSSASAATESQASKALLEGGDLSSYEKRMGEHDFSKSMTSNITAFTYDEPAGWEKETTDRFVLYKKTDGKDVLAIIVVAQDDEDHAKDKPDMNRLEGNAYSSCCAVFLDSDSSGCNVEESDKKYGFAGVPTSPSKNTCYIDGCGVREEDYAVTGNPSFGEFKGSMLAVGAGDAKLSAGLLSCDSAYEECRKDFLALAGSVHLSESQRGKVKALLGEDPIIGNTFSGESIYEILEKPRGSSGDVGTSDEGGRPYGTGTYGDGMYKVGTDIPAGEYKLTASSGTLGYWEVTNSSTANADIVGNDNFSGSTYVTVSDGQYLKLERCVAEPA